MYQPPFHLSQESFPSIEPFDFSVTANYFKPMTAILVCSWPPLFLALPLTSMVANRALSFAWYLGHWARRHNFWSFCAANFFFTDLFGGSASVALAYASDVFPGRLQTDIAQNKVVASNLVGRTGGGIIAILMQSLGLFVPPLLASAAISLLTAIISFIGS